MKRSRPRTWRNLEQRLEGDPEAQRRYLHYLDLHADLVRVDGGEQGEELSFGVSGGVTGLAAGLAAAAAIALARLVVLGFRMSAVFAGTSGSRGRSGWSGQVDRRRGRRLLRSRVGDHAAGRDLWKRWRPIPGPKWTFPDGTSVSLAGQSSLAISQAEGRKVLRLREGNLSIEAARQPAGFPLKVVTPSAEAEVLGTQFNVKANEFSARFAVNEGLVRVTRLADGKVEEVAAEEVVVAALEQGTDFTAGPRRAFVESWQSELPRDQLQGRWEPGSTSDPGGLRAMPHLWKGDHGLREKPVLLYSAVLDPSAGRRPPLRLSEQTRLTVRGRLDREHRIDVGFGTNRTRGGPVAKYSVANGIVVSPDEDGRFSLELNLSTFRPTREHFPVSLAGQEVDWLWIQTVKVDAGLVVESVELRK